MNVLSRYETMCKDAKERGIPVGDDLGLLVLADVTEDLRDAVVTINHTLELWLEAPDEPDKPDKPEK